MLILLHSGQTGVERGAHRAALAAGIQLAGFSPIDGRDELGQLPGGVAQYLTPCFERGSRPPVRANVALASGLLVVVPDARTPDKFTGIGVTLKAARELGVPYRIADPATSLDDLVTWARALPETSGSVRLMVTGPRETRWIDGDKVAWQIVAAIALA